MAAHNGKESDFAKSSILLVDDHPVMRDGFAQLINHEPDLHVSGYASSTTEAMEAVAALKPDLAIVDISLQGADGIELVKDITAQFPRVRILVLSMYDERVYAERALRAGASGYVMKQSPTERVLQCIREVLRGEYSFSDAIQARLLQRLRNTGKAQPPSELASLTDRELEVFLLIGKGQKNQEIANTLHVSVKTVDSYRLHIKEKLGLSSSADLVHRAIEYHTRHVG